MYQNPWLEKDQQKNQEQSVSFVGGSYTAWNSKPVITYSSYSWPTTVANNSVIAGGENNSVSGNWSFISGGFNNTVNGEHSGAIGSGAVVDGNHCLQFGEGKNSDDYTAQFGDAVRISLRKGQPSNVNNGDIWVENGFVYVQSGGKKIKIK